MKKEAKAAIAAAAGIFGSLALAEDHVCDCADVVYRNNYDGSRDYKLKGNPNCPKCRGVGAHQKCSSCQGCGMMPGSRICSACHGSGRVPLTPSAIHRRIA